MIFKKINRKAVFAIVLLMITMATSCKRSIEEISLNPNKTEQTNPSNILTYLSIYAFAPDFLGINRQLDVYFIDNRFGGYHLNWLRRNFTNEYRHITIANKMREEAERLNEPAYIPIATFFRTYWIFNTTRLYGDVPYSEANRVNEGINLPIYDRQDDIIFNILEELKTANEELAALGDITIKGDIIYGGKITKWRKLINMQRLRILINLSMKESVKGLNVKQAFAEIVNNPADNPLMENLDDSPIRYEDDSPNNYWAYLDNNFISGYRVTKFVVDYMKDHKDFRLTKFAQPTIYAENNKLDPNDLNNYAGTDPWPNKDNNANYQLEDSKRVSRVNNRYHREPIGPPTMIMGYPEQEYILAEAALRGWITGDPEVSFEKGIRASFAYFEVADKVNAYLATPGVKLSGTDTEKLNRIITEKYLNFFMQGGYEPYFEIRRTGYPDFKEYAPIDISTLYNNGKLPLRHLYPLGEITDNKSNILQAIGRLSNGDNIFSEMWLIQGEDALRNPSPFPFQ